MPRYKELFTLYKRRTKSGKEVYYYRTYDEDGNRTNGVSTGLSSKPAAKQYVLNLFKEGKLVPKKSISFADFTEDFWVWGKCRYITRCNTYGKKGISQEHARTERGYLVNHIAPYFGSQKLTAIRSKDIETYVLHLKNNSHLSDGSINHILKIVKIIFAEAVREDKIFENPAKSVGYLKAKQQKRGILTLKEVQLIFDERQIEKIWGGCSVTYSMNLFAATTGVRRGEILGLLNKYLHKEYVEIIHGWGAITGLKETTKSKESRFVPIPERVSYWLHSIRKGGKDDFLFSLHDGKKHYPENEILIRFYKALECIGISKQERTKRNIKFHSWRHFFNTICRVKNLSDAKVQAVTGHKTRRMTDHYTHFKIEDFREVIDVQKSILQGE